MIGLYLDMNCIRSWQDAYSASRDPSSERWIFRKVMGASWNVIYPFPWKSIPHRAIVEAYPQWPITVDSVYCLMGGVIVITQMVALSGAWTKRSGCQVDLDFKLGLGLRAPDNYFGSDIEANESALLGGPRVVLAKGIVAVDVVCRSSRAHLGIGE